MKTITYQTDKKHSSPIQKYGCLFKSIAYFSKKDISVEEQNSIWDMLVRNEAITGDLNGDGDVDDELESTIMNHDAVAEALGDNSTASGGSSIALGYYAEASNDYQITIGNKFVYFRFPSSTTEATVYNALSPWLNPSAPSGQGAMGSFGTNSINRLRRSGSTTIELYNITNTCIKTISSGSTNQIGEDLAICTVKF